MTMSEVEQREGLDDDEEIVKKEALEEECCECAVSEKTLKSMEDNVTLHHLFYTPPTLTSSTTNTSSMGKLKKPKEMKKHPGSKLKRLTSIEAHRAADLVIRDRVGKSMSCRREKTASNALNSPGEVKSSTLIRAEEVQSSLGTEFPSFAKLMVRSHVTSGFWMSLPMPFCKSHLPTKDATVILEDESGEQFQLKFLAEKTGLSAGWKKFAVGHKLLEGDALVFQLVEADKFKVYIIRANDLTEVDGALGLLNLDAHAKESNAVPIVHAGLQKNTERGMIAIKNQKRKHPESISLAMAQKKKKRTGLSKSVPKLVQAVESENDSEVVGSKVLAGSELSDTALQFRDIKGFEDFNILLNGLCIDSEFPEHIRTKYYQLCCSKNAFLHARILQHVNWMLVAGIIFETVNIADAIKACKLTTSRDEFTTWENTLKSFELLGMNVGFLISRLLRLQTIVFESAGALDTKRYIEAKTERIRAKDEIRNLEAKLVKLREASKKFDADIETLKSKAESHELKFRLAVNAPW